MLDYERLVRRIAELEVENEVLKNPDTERRRNENRRWDRIEEQPEIGTKTEEARLRRVIREWEERYDILNELYVRSAIGQSKDWWEAKAAVQARKKEIKDIEINKKVKLDLVQSLKNLIKRILK